MNNENQLSSGIFWVISDNEDLSDYTLLTFKIPCNPDGTPLNTHTIPLNSKSGNNYNHKKIWETEVKNNSKYRPYNKKEFDYYPRGRVEIANGKAKIFKNEYITNSDIEYDILKKFGLCPKPNGISDVSILTDGSKHYRCFLDKENWYELDMLDFEQYEKQRNKKQ